MSSTNKRPRTDDDDGDDERFSLKTTLKSIERALAENLEQRAAHPEHGRRFASSELALHEHLDALRRHVPTNLSVLDALTRYEPRAAGLGLVMSVVDHPNADVAAVVWEFLGECLDEDAEAQAATGDDQSTSVQARFVRALVEECDLLPLMHRFWPQTQTQQAPPDIDKEDLEARQSLEQTFMSILENGLTLGGDDWLAERVYAQHGLFGRLVEQCTEDSLLITTRQYAAELVAMVMQSLVAARSTVSRPCHLYTQLTSRVLQTLATYRKRDPADSAEQEYMENMFDIACCAMQLRTAVGFSYRSLFIHEEGTQLMMLMMEKKLMSRLRALKVLSYATTPNYLVDAELLHECKKCAEVSLDFAGLKHVVSALLGKAGKKLRRAYPRAYSRGEELEHSLSVLSSYLSLLTDEAPNFYLSRVKARLMEKEVVQVLVAVHDEYAERLAPLDEELVGELERVGGDDEAALADLVDAFYLERLDAGLYTLQLVSIILLTLFGGGGAEGKVPVDRLRRTVQEYVDRLSDMQELDGFPADAHSAAIKVAVLRRKLALQSLLLLVTKGGVIPTPP